MYCKRLELRNSQMGERHGARCGERAQSVHAFPSVLLCRHCYIFTSLEALWTLSFGVHTEASLNKCDWLNNWLLVIDSVSRLSPCSPPSQGWDWKFLWSPGWFSWQLTPIPRSQSHLMNVMENWESLRVLEVCARTGHKEKIFLTVNHSVTTWYGQTQVFDILVCI